MSAKPVADFDLTEYDDAALWCAKRGLSGLEGTPLPSLLSVSTYAEINEHPEEFAARVRATAYALAMERVENNPND